MKKRALKREKSLFWNKIWNQTQNKKMDGTHPALRPTPAFRAFERDVMENPGSHASSLMEEIVSYTNLEILPNNTDRETLYRIAKQLAQVGDKKAFHNPVWRLRQMKRPERIQILTVYFFQKLYREPHLHLPVLFESVHRALRERPTRKRWFATFEPGFLGADELTVTVG